MADAPKAISTFSGCGGASLGLRFAGFNVLVASEFIEEARDTYRTNSPGTPVLPDDIRQLEPDDLMSAAGVQKGEVDLFEGSPPCSAFSMSGQRHKAWGEAKQYSTTEQVADDLFFEFARMVDGIQPKVFLAENVVGLTIGKAKGYFKLIRRRLEECGYVVQARVLKAELLGVPQSRHRLIFMGVRKDLERPPAFPKPLKYRYTIAEAFEAPMPDDDREPWEVTLELLREYQQLKPGEHSKRYFNLWRTSYNKPCPTYVQTASRRCACVLHPHETRPFTIPELKRLSGFPDDFILTGNYQQAAERIGRAVVPPMYQHVGRAIREEILSA
jgi:DNA (cytosine-5)-methyltransferase 1